MLHNFIELRLQPSDTNSLTFRQP